MTLAVGGAYEQLSLSRLLKRKVDRASGDCSFECGVQTSSWKKENICFENSEFKKGISKFSPTGESTSMLASGLASGDTSHPEVGCFSRSPLAV